MKRLWSRQQLGAWLCQGISPRQLALTLALGCAIGCIPVVGVPTLLCTGLALALRLNLPAIQAANYVVMPLQILLIFPFFRMGAWLLPLHAGAGASVQWAAGMALQALLGWAIVAIPAVLLMTVTLTYLLRRIPALATMEAGN